MYNYNHLYYFYTTVKSGGVTSAAQHLSISQPSLSGQLKVLEDFLQIKLFKKIGRKKELTTRGEQIFGFCRQMFELSEKMNDSITNNTSSSSRKIHVGVSNEVANSLLLDVISHFRNKFSDKLCPQIVIISGSDEELIEQLRFREIDVIITPTSATNLDIENLQSIEVPVYLICAQNSKISLQKKKFLNTNSALKAFNEDNLIQWVMPSYGLKLRTETNEFLKVNHLEGNITFENDIMESLTRSVIDKVGIVFLPQIYIPKEFEKNSLCLLGPKEGYWKHQIVLAGHAKNKDDHLINSFSLSFKEICDPTSCNMKKVPLAPVV